MMKCSRVVAQIALLGCLGLGCGEGGDSAAVDGGVVPDGGGGGSLAVDWTATLGTPNDEFATAVIAGQGLVVAGQYADSITLGSAVHASVGSQDAFVAKATSPLLQDFVWSVSMGGLGIDRIVEVAVAPNGNVIIAGFFEDDLSIGEHSFESSGGFDIVIAALDRDTGQVVWVNHFGGEGNDEAGPITISGDNVFVGGFIQGEVSVGGALIGSFSEQSAFVASYGLASGQHLWSRASNGGAAVVRSLALLADGQVIATGTFEGSADFGRGPLLSEGVDVFVVRYSKDGATDWSVRYGGYGRDVPTGVESSSDAKSFVLTGTFEGKLNLGKGDLFSDSADMFVAKYDASGQHQWSHRSVAAAEGGVAGTGISRLDGESYVLSGYAAASARFGSIAVESNGSLDLMVAVVSSEGFLDVATFGGASDDYAWATDCCIEGAAVVAGQFSGQIDLRGHQLTSEGGQDVLLFGLRP